MSLTIAQAIKQGLLETGQGCVNDSDLYGIGVTEYDGQGFQVLSFQGFEIIVGLALTYKGYIVNGFDHTAWDGDDGEAFLNEALAAAILRQEGQDNYRYSVNVVGKHEWLEDSEWVVSS